MSVSQSNVAKATRLNPLRVGVIGVGNMGQHHTRVLSLLKDVQLFGVSDVNVERGLDVASKYQVRFFEDYVQLLKHVDAVCIAVPTRLHHSVGRRCLESGVHVLIEKPIAASIAEAESLVNIAAETNCILQVGHIERFNPAFQELDKVLKTEGILALEAARMSPYSDFFLLITSMKNPKSSRKFLFTKCSASTFPFSLKRWGPICAFTLPK
ncbi:MAG: Gfo/Idh/MocA family oxidoreductase, partial [Cyanobacteria bacterium P01_H01_bin.15]